MFRKLIIFLTLVDSITTKDKRDARQKEVYKIQMRSRSSKRSGVYNLPTEKTRKICSQCKQEYENNNNRGFLSAFFEQYDYFFGVLYHLALSPEAFQL
jgi:hypothetical protein